MSESFKAGDMVRVLRRVKKQPGWDNLWVGSMDASIGKTLKVLSDSQERGINLDNGFAYPSTALELVLRRDEQQKGQ